MVTGRPWRAAVAVLLAIALAAVGAGPASAALTASLQSLALPTTPYSHNQQTITGRAVLTVTDTSAYLPPIPPLTPGIGTGAGWHVTEQASALTYSGPNNGTAIPASALAIVSVEAPVASSGSQPVDPTNGPTVPTVSPAGSLNSARMVLHANSGYGAGTYTQGINLSLTLPAQARAGTYTSTITTTIGSGP
ncbi:hypothetical protein AB0O52_07410 [Arthrobacter sp. NPDC080073]|uniref:hypothetical protein n=1 Tax=Arthrobacter sp. NPDC080073 TaxID=3155919 RepID=UPI0034321CAE